MPYPSSRQLSFDITLFPPSCVPIRVSHALYAILRPLPSRLFSRIGLSSLFSAVLWCGHFIAYETEKIAVGTKLAIVKGPYCKSTASTLTFLLNFQATLQNSIYEHWIIWSQISEIRSHKKVKPKELTVIRDRLFVLGQNAISKRNRINQMQGYISRREKIIGENDFFTKEPAQKYLHRAHMNLLYLQEHWGMLESYSEGTVELLTLMYSETQEKEMLFLQGLFLMGVVASLLALGAMPGATITLYDNAENLIATGRLSSFFFEDLMRYGIIALISTFIVYKLIRMFYEMRSENVN
jgi:hypothetical protein